AHRVDVVDQIADLAFELELRVELGRDRDGQAVLLGERPALLGAPLDDDVRRLQHDVVNLKTAIRKLLELTGLQALLDRAKRRAVLRAEHGEVRLDAPLDGVDGPELDLLDAQLLTNLVGVTRGPRRPLHDEPAQRLPQLDARVRARAPPELAD